MVGLLGCRARSWTWMILAGLFRLRILNSVNLFSLYHMPVRSRRTGSSRHHICVISPTIRLQRWGVMKKFYFSDKRSYLVLLLSGFLLPSTVRRGAGGAPGVLLLCIPWTDLSVIPILHPGIMELSGCRLRKLYLFFFLFYSFVSMFGWTPGFLTQQSHIYIYIYTLYNLSQGQLKSHYFIFSCVKTV